MGKQWGIEDFHTKRKQGKKREKSRAPRKHMERKESIKLQQFMMLKTFLSSMKIRNKHDQRSRCQVLH